jgi:hypothetical protein
MSHTLTSGSNDGEMLASFCYYTTWQVKRQCLASEDHICIAQVIKQYARRRVVGVKHRLVQGTSTQVEVLLQWTQGGGQINTAYAERLIATFRSHMAGLIRRGRALARQTNTLHYAMYLMNRSLALSPSHVSSGDPYCQYTPDVEGKKEPLAITQGLFLALCLQGYSIIRVLILKGFGLLCPLVQEPFALPQTTRSCWGRISISRRLAASA